MKNGDVITVLHHDWMPDGKVIEQMGKIRQTIVSEDKKIGEMVLVDVYGHNGQLDGSGWYRLGNTKTDYYWLKEGWDGKPTGEPKDPPTLEEKATRITDEERKKVEETEDGGRKSKKRKVKGVKGRKRVSRRNLKPTRKSH